MRILQVITRSDSGGAQSIVLSLSESLCEYGHTVAVVSGPGGGGEAWRSMDPRVERIEARHLIRSVSPIKDLLATAELRRLYRKWKPDIVHLHTSKAGAVGRLAGGIPRNRIVYTMHGYDQLRVANRKFMKVDWALRKLCGAIVGVSKVDVEAMMVDGYKARFVGNGTKDSRSLPLASDAILRRISEIRGQYSALAILVARDAIPKRLDLAREAAKRLTSGAGILWIGGEPRPDDPPNFHALGTARNGGAYIALCDIFMLLSDHEGLSVSMLEAFSAGVATIASAVPGCLEALGLEEDGMGAYGIGVENEAGAIARAIDLLAQDEALRKNLGFAARAAWERDFSSGTMTGKYISIYKELVGE